MKRIACVVAVAALFTNLSRPTVFADTDAMVRFSAIGCGPYELHEEEDLLRQIADENARGESAFMIHLGDIMAGSTPATEARYARVAEILRELKMPTFIVPGDNEWNDQAAPDKAWSLWRQYFNHFDALWSTNVAPLTEPKPALAEVLHQDVRPENFSFVHKGVLFVGINLPGGTVHDRAEWALRLPQNAQWIEANIRRSGSAVRAAVIFAQALPNADNESFFAEFRASVARFAKPVLYLHADGHSWVRDQPWPEANLLRVQTDQLGIAQPLLVTVASKGDGVDIFQFDRRYRRGPYLAMGGSDRMTIVWRRIGKTLPEVRIGDRPDNLTRRIEGHAILSRQADGAGNPTSLARAREGAVQYEANITDLSPDTKYYYGVYDGEALMAGADANHWFRTNPEPGVRRPFRFWVVGDSGTGAQPQADVRDAMQKRIAAEAKPLDFYMHLGDMAYGSGLDHEFQHHYFEPYETILRNTVCWPTMGNHEGQTANGVTGLGPYYDCYVLPKGGEVGGEPSGTEAYYAFDYGNAHFVCLDSHDVDRSPGGAMARWLKADLESTKADWLIAYWHHPPYTKGTHDSDTSPQLIEMREHIMPILEGGGVDVVFTGHSHIYERSMLMDGAYATPTAAETFILDDGDGSPVGDGPYRKSAGLQPHEGTVQVVAGHGGTGVGRLGYMPVMKSVHVENGSVLVDIDGDHLTASMLNKDGLQRDIFRIVKQGTVQPKRIANPKRPPYYLHWPELGATVSLTEVVQADAATDYTLTIPAYPLDGPCTGALTWRTEGTSWTLTPAATNFTMEPNQVTVLRGTAVHGQCLFPMAVPALTQETPEGQRATTARFELPAYKRTAVHPMAAMPVIDGLLQASELSGLVREGEMIEINGNGPAANASAFYLGIIEDRLYIAIQNQEPQMANMTLPVRERDGEVWADNCNELFLQLEGETNYYQVAVAASGQVADGRLGEGAEGFAWTGDFTSAVHRGTGEWTVEVLFAPELFGRPLKEGDTIRLNVTRTNPIHGEKSQWSHTFRKGNLWPALFGTAVVE
ncbi:MAG: metallophosphoesterase [Verrucomicrobia bacterium]|nr:metallophosphoesterase [Verrucomicrobiota bacterium]